MWKGGTSVAQNLGKSRGQGLGGRSHGLLLFVPAFTDGVPWQHQLLDHSVRRTLWGEAVFRQGQPQQPHGALGRALGFGELCLVLHHCEEGLQPHLCDTVSEKIEVQEDLVPRHENFAIAVLHRFQERVDHLSSFPNQMF